MKPYYRVENERFDTLAEAQQRAEELAAKFPGRCFEILRCVGVASTSKPSTFWTDREYLPEKPRYRMLDVGEIVANGDEFNLRQSGEWRRHTVSIGMEIGPDNYPTRRPL